MKKNLIPEKWEDVLIMCSSNTKSDKYVEVPLFIAYSI